MIFKLTESLIGSENAERVKKRLLTCVCSDLHPMFAEDWKHSRILLMQDADRSDI